MRIAIVTDIHEDIKSLNLAFKKIDKMKIDKVVCLGDISGFSAPHYEHYNSRSAHECLKLIRQNCETIVLGNHDLHVIKRIPENSPEFKYPDNWYDLDYFVKKFIAKGRVWLYEENELQALYTNEDISFLSEKKEIEILEVDGKRIFLSHFAYPNLTGSERTFYHDSFDFSDHFSLMKDNTCPISIMGHAHSDGIMYFTQTNSYRNRFKKCQLPNEPVCIVAPSITQNGIRNGFLIFDTDKFEIEAVKL